MGAKVMTDVIRGPFHSQPPRASVSTLTLGATRARRRKPSDLKQTLGERHHAHPAAGLPKSVLARARVTRGAEGTGGARVGARCARLRASGGDQSRSSPARL